MEERFEQGNVLRHPQERSNTRDLLAISRFNFGLGFDNSDAATLIENLQPELLYGWRGDGDKDMMNRH